jgi:hypothetical protein
MKAAHRGTIMEKDIAWFEYVTDTVKYSGLPRALIIRH